MIKQESINLGATTNHPCEIQVGGRPPVWPSAKRQALRPTITPYTEAPVIGGVLKTSCRIGVAETISDNAPLHVSYVRQNINVH